MSRQGINVLQDVRKGHKAEHLLFKGEREKKEAKMVTRGQKSLGVDLACPLKGPETKRNNSYKVITNDDPE